MPKAKTQTKPKYHADIKFEWIVRQIEQRCYNKNNKDYANYGGRGIRVCSTWRGKDGWRRFLADMGRPPVAGMTIDRKDNNGHYEKSNCEWRTRKEQCRNMRVNHNLTVGGVTRCLVDWAEIKGMPRSTLSDRLHRGWSDEAAVNTPVRKQKSKQPKK